MQSGRRKGAHLVLFRGGVERFELCKGGGVNAERASTRER